MIAGSRRDFLRHARPPVRRRRRSASIVRCRECSRSTAAPQIPPQTAAPQGDTPHEVRRADHYRRGQSPARCRRRRHRVRRRHRCRAADARRPARAIDGDRSQEDRPADVGESRRQHVARRCRGADLGADRRRRLHCRLSGPLRSRRPHRVRPDPEPLQPRRQPVQCLPRRRLGAGARRERCRCRDRGRRRGAADASSRGGHGAGTDIAGPRRDRGELRAGAPCGPHR